jgi:hypothetical protein
MVKTFEAVQFWWLSHELMRLEGSLPPAMTKNWSLEVSAALTFALNQCKMAGLGDAAILPLYSVGAELQRFDLTLDYVTDVRPQLKAARHAIECRFCLCSTRWTYSSILGSSEMPRGFEVIPVVTSADCGPGSTLNRPIQDE